MTAATDARVHLEVDGPVAVVTINRPKVRNAVDRPTAEAISAAWDEIDGRSDIRAAVLTGAGGFFCAGMDLKAFSATKERPISEARGGFGIVEKPPRTPVVAAVEGKALGGGFEIALACDLIVAAEDAWFGLPEVKRGLIAAAGGVLRLPQRVPRSVAKHLVLTGEPVGAYEAERLGLVTEVARTGRALEAAVELAGRIASNAPMAVRGAKQILDESIDWPVAEAFARQQAVTDPVRASRDAAEGARAFVEKRDPVWVDG
ncbi:crotonase/enoyl-CoA hydratase family protein [Actinomycetospora sp. TBRC 11914]|uniref:crotonase/enoyl-CoA hydratase family protein n=1 Tax=Actinomycetospora sp. TBRC 11914 TaxID=2729387 RepID=UPI00145EACEE|nr:crotonase/enoyl-CoA hydratase family protein [Actinomycetospora sp. TBRC 11914]NMO91650.1 crotonase/enoyl-CoA hydratase family protein [Actinomycetospora sp. TBRC 11914]